MRTCDDNEKAVVEAACRGDVEAMAGLYERYYAMMVWVAYSVLSDRSLAEDAAQRRASRQDRILQVGKRNTPTS